MALPFFTRWFKAKLVPANQKWSAASSYRAGLTAVPIRGSAALHSPAMPILPDTWRVAKIHPYIPFVKTNIQSMKESDSLTGVAAQAKYMGKTIATAKLSIFPYFIWPVAPGLAVATVLAGIGPDSSGFRFAAPVALVWFGLCWIHLFWARMSFRGVLAKRRLFVRQGFFVRREDGVSLSKISDVGMLHSLPGLFLGYGTILVETGGSCPVVLKGISHPSEFRRAIYEAIHANDERRDVFDL